MAILTYVQWPFSPLNTQRLNLRASNKSESRNESHHTTHDISPPLGPHPHCWRNFSAVQIEKEIVSFLRRGKGILQQSLAPAAMADDNERTELREEGEENGDAWDGRETGGQEHTGCDKEGEQHMSLLKGFCSVHLCALWL